MPKPARRSFPRPRSARAWLLTVFGAVIGVGAAGILFIYFVLFGQAAPAPLALTSPPATTQSPALTATSVPGTWTVASKSVAGYRVHEQLAFLSAPSDAVGRTSQITGSATITGSGAALTVIAASFTVNVQSLTSDQSMRDSHIQILGLESAQFPHATFALSSPVMLPANATSGAEIALSLHGALTIHGTTRTVTIPVRARLSGSEIEVVGSITFPWGEFNMLAPNIGGFVTVNSAATMEFDLFLKHS
ncbi:MAG TPA: YceI family protein [Candidatus Dormibacteraeota bacterium]